MTKESENELAKAVTGWLREDHWQVFEEVSPWGAGGGRADLVAKKGSVIWVIECKRQFNLQVLEQASNWTASAHFVSIAVWHPKTTAAIIDKVCQKFGIGLLTVRELSSWNISFEVIERQAGFFNRRAKTQKIKAMLDENTRARGEAGKGGQSFYTPFKKTCLALIRLATENPGIELEEAVRRGSHHYADDRKAKINLKNVLETNQIPELKISRLGKRLLIYPNLPENPVKEAAIKTTLPKLLPVQENLF